MTSNDLARFKRAERALQPIASAFRFRNNLTEQETYLLLYTNKVLDALRHTIREQEEGDE